VKRYLVLILALVLVGCNLPDPQEAARLKTENETLQAQVAALTSERDAAMLERNDLLERLEKIKTALENLPSSSMTAPTPAPTVPETPTTPDTSVPVPDTTVPSVPEVTPAPETTPVVPNTPDSSIPALPPVSAGADDSALEKLQVYANEVLTAAQNFKAQTRQEAPLNCTNGYAAGAYNVQDSLDLKECSLVAESNGDYRVTARDAAGNSVSVP
jgi:hypothetical protein